MSVTCDLPCALPGQHSPRRSRGSHVTRQGVVRQPPASHQRWKTCWRLRCRCPRQVTLPPQRLTERTVSCSWRRGMRSNHSHPSQLAGEVPRGPRGLRLVSGGHGGAPGSLPPPLPLIYLDFSLIFYLISVRPRRPLHSHSLLLAPPSTHPSPSRGHHPLHQPLRQRLRRLRRLRHPSAALSPPLPMSPSDAHADAPSRLSRPSLRNPTDRACARACADMPGRALRCCGTPRGRDGAGDRSESRVETCPPPPTVYSWRGRAREGGDRWDGG